jgi:hypothetical protein
MTDSLNDTLVNLLRMTRQAERDIFGGIDSGIRDRPMREGDWSPKDHQAHLTAWKARQADRFAAARRGEEPPQTADGQTDAINAKLQAERADWPWDAIVQEAEEVSERLNREIATSGQETFERFDRLISGTFGNGPMHAMSHFGWLLDADIGVDGERVATFVRELTPLIEAGGLPDSDLGTALYNTACAHTLAGRLDEARPLLQRAFQLRPDLVAFAPTDDDLLSIRDELAGLASTP